MSSDNRSTNRGETGVRGTRSATEPFRLAVLGCGEGQGQPRISAARELVDEGVELAAVADFDIGRARAAGKRLGVPVFDRLDEMVEQIDLHGIIVALSPEAQAGATVYALEHRLDVLCDEPFGSSPRDARRMIRAAAKAGRVLATGYLHPLRAEAALTFASSTGIGAPSGVEVDWRRAVTSGPSSTDGPRYWGRSGDRRICADLAAQALSVSLPLLGSPARSVHAHGWSEGQTKLLNLRVHCKSGALGLLTVALGARPWEDEDLLALRSLGSAGGWLRLPFTVSGLGAEVLTPTVLHPDSWRAQGAQLISTKEAIALQQRRWLRACRGQEPLGSGPEDALAVHEVLDAAYRSASLRGQRTRV